MALEDRFDKGWWHKLSPFLLGGTFWGIARKLFQEGERTYVTPHFDHTFRAFKECKYDELKVVLLGLDPYPASGVADGLAFSSRTSEKPPKSLNFILRAIEKEVYGGFGIGFNNQFDNPDLTRWANQGVLLLNTALSTVVGETGTHLEIWGPFTQYVFRTLREYNTGVIYILLGAKAKQWGAAIDKERNYVLTASHPSSCNYSGKKEWDSEGVFSKANEILEKQKLTKILW